MNFFVGNEKIDSSCLKGIIIMVMIMIIIVLVLGMIKRISYGS